jgi:hypothetical protein
MRAILAHDLLMFALSSHFGEVLDVLWLVARRGACSDRLESLFPRSSPKTRRLNGAAVLPASRVHMQQIAFATFKRQVRLKHIRTLHTTLGPRHFSMLLRLGQQHTFLVLLRSLGPRFSCPFFLAR